MDNEQLKSNLTSSRHWLRLVFMLLFAGLVQVAGLVMWIVVVVQFLFSLITGDDNLHLRRFGHSLSTYIYDVLKFLCYSSQEKPFPFADWPSSADSSHDLTVATPPATPPATQVRVAETAAGEGSADRPSDETANK